MGFNCGIVGLPNVGKSTLFNALTETAAAEAANYPFCTIEPNTGRVAVPDPRLDALAALAKSQNIIPTQLEFIDIAGLVRGASKGEGLGNQFLSNIREVDAIAHDAGFRTNRGSRVPHSSGQRRGDLEIKGLNVAGTSDLIIDVAIVHDFRFSFIVSGKTPDTAASVQ